MHEFAAWKMSRPNTAVNRLIFNCINYVSVDVITVAQISICWERLTRRTLGWVEEEELYGRCCKRPGLCPADERLCTPPSLLPRDTGNPSLHTHTHTHTGNIYEDAQAVDEVHVSLSHNEVLFACARVFLLVSSCFLLSCTLRSLWSGL